MELKLCLRSKFVSVESKSVEIKESQLTDGPTRTMTLDLLEEAA